MDVLASTEFRKVYAKLTRDTRVTVNGHVIGTWSPAGAGYMTVTEAKESSRTLHAKVVAERSFAEFRPVPKPGVSGKPVIGVRTG
jgi:hypothetical protein